MSKSSIKIKVDPLAKHVPPPQTIPSAMFGCLISPNEMDRNFEAANVVDGLFTIARAINQLAQAIKERAK